MSRFTLWFLVVFSWCVTAQNTSINTKTLTVAIADSIKLENVSINPNQFSVKMKNGFAIDTSLYHINFQKALLTFKTPVYVDSLVITYQNYPEFLTKTYKLFDESVIVDNNSNIKRLQQLTQTNTGSTYKPFDGLNTSGSISRGVTIGNNQNAVLNSALDLQVSGKLNDNVTLRASIQDANVPLQESGYSQRLDEFDQVFIELFSDNWKIRAGDIDLENNSSYFSKFTKRVQGLSVNAALKKEHFKTNFFGAGALVRGQFTTSQFAAQEGNQGPYKLEGFNGELFVLIVSGSETVYVNGIAVKRGENEDYIIDYNAGEIIFNPTFPITSEMRVTVDYQYSERNYSRLVGYGGVQLGSEKLNLGVSVYSENDSKNNPLQQNLSADQVAILSNAGDDKTFMVAPSATEEVYNKNRILYKKQVANGVSFFEFSNNPNDKLYSVRFTKVPENTGNYVIDDSIDAITAIYKYVLPINGIPQGNYEPIIQLVAPAKLQVAVLNGNYLPSDNTTITFEVAASKNDENLFSNLDDANNDGFAARLSVTQNIFKKDSVWTLKGIADVDYIKKEFRNIEGLYNPEFNRDWNLEVQPSSNLITTSNNQLLYSSGVFYKHNTLGTLNYRFEYLNLSEMFNGTKHSATSNLTFGGWQLSSVSSVLNADSDKAVSTFIRSYNTIQYKYKKFWLGGGVSAENNQQKDKDSLKFTNLSQKFTAYEAFTGVGDTSKVYTQIGYKFRVNDSLRANLLQKVNVSNTYYLDSRLVKTKLTNLGMYVNYRALNQVFEEDEDEKSLNSRLQFSQLLLKKKVHWNTLFETNSGTLPQQDFSYVEVEAGQGAYMWIDYNNNGVQELNEFELAQFEDQAKYIRVLLPNQVFIKTHEFKFSQTLTLNPYSWATSKNKTKKWVSHFYNQSSYLTHRKNERNAANFDPLNFDKENPLGIQLNFKNVLFYNRGKQRYTTSYTYLKSNTKNVLSIGYIENTLESHQLNFNHKIKNTWLTQLFSSIENSKSDNENFNAKNFKIDTYKLQPKLSYLLNDNTRFELLYQFTKKDNYRTKIEKLEQHKYGIIFSYTPKKAAEKAAITGEFSYFNNTFNGNAATPVGFQLLEGLQPGKNFTWRLLAQQKLTKFLDLNINYLGRATQDSKAIHTGSVELKAYF